MMHCVELSGIGNVQIGTIPIPQLLEHEVLVQVASCGFCGTDMHIFTGEAPATLPLIPGHEFGGIVVSCGQKVKRFNINDRVAVDPNISCGFCSYCKSGKIHLCTSLQAIGVTRPGGFAEFVAVPESQLYRFPDCLSLDLAAFVEPLSCCIHGMDIIAVKPGEHVVIAGAGAIGLYMLQLARLAGAASVVMLEPVTERQRSALDYGATACLSPDDKNFSLALREFQPAGADVLIECAGNARAFELLLSIAPKGARILLFGLAGKSETAGLPMQEIFHKELALFSSLLNPFTFQRAINLLERQLVSVEKIPLHIVPITELAIGAVYSRSQNVNTLKNIIQPHL